MPVKRYIDADELLKRADEKLSYAVMCVLGGIIGDMPSHVAFDEGWVLNESKASEGLSDEVDRLNALHDVLKHHNPLRRLGRSEGLGENPPTGTITPTEIEFLKRVDCFSSGFPKSTRKAVKIAYKLLGGKPLPKPDTAKLDELIEKVSDSEVKDILREFSRWLREG